MRAGVVRVLLPVAIVNRIYGILKYIYILIIFTNNIWSY